MPVFGICMTDEFAADTARVHLQHTGLAAMTGAALFVSLVTIPTQTDL